MEWLKAESVNDLKKYGKLQYVRKIIAKDLANVFKEKKSKDKNIVSMININSGSWQGLLDKIKAFREIIEELDLKNYNEQENKEDIYFRNKESEYIFYLLELDGKERADKLNMNRKCYSSKKEAKAWRDSIAKIIHPDKCSNPKANDAIVKLNQLYSEMI